VNVRDEVALDRNFDLGAKVECFRWSNGEGGAQIVENGR
jgi:hypothetical protein